MDFRETPGVGNGKFGDNIWISFKTFLLSAEGHYIVSGVGRGGGSRHDLLQALHDEGPPALQQLSRPDLNELVSLSVAKNWLSEAYEWGGVCVHISESIVPGDSGRVPPSPAAGGSQSAPVMAAPSPRTPLPSYMDAPPVTVPRGIQEAVDEMKDWVEWTVEQAGPAGYPLFQLPLDYQRHFGKKLNYKAIGVKQLKGLVGYMSDVVTLAAVDSVDTLFHKTKKLPVKRELSPPKKPVPTGWAPPPGATAAANVWAMSLGKGAATPRGADRASSSGTPSASSTSTPSTRPGPGGPRRVATGWETDEGSGHDAIPTVWNPVAQSTGYIQPCAEPYIRELRRLLPKAIRLAGKDGFPMSSIPNVYRTEFGKPLDYDKAGVKKLVELVDMMPDLFDKVFEKGQFVLRLPEKPQANRPRPPRPVEPGEVTVLNRATPQPSQAQPTSSSAGWAAGAGSASIAPLSEATLALRQRLVDNVASLLRCHLAGVNPRQGCKVGELERWYRDTLGEPLDYGAAGFGSIMDLLGEDRILEVCRTEPSPYGGGIMYPVEDASTASCPEGEAGHVGGSGSGWLPAGAFPTAANGLGARGDAAPAAAAGNGSWQSVGGRRGYGDRPNGYASDGHAHNGFSQNGFAQKSGAYSPTQTPAAPGPTAPVHWQPANGQKGYTQGGYPKGGGACPPAQAPTAPAPMGHGSWQPVDSQNGYAHNGFAQNGGAQTPVQMQVLPACAVPPNKSVPWPAAPRGNGTHQPVGSQNGYGQTGEGRPPHTQVLPAGAVPPNKPVSWASKLNRASTGTPAGVAPTQRPGPRQPQNNGAGEAVVDLENLLLHD